MVLRMTKAAAGRAVSVGAAVLPGHTDYETICRGWRDAEELGVDALFVPDHFFPGPAEPDGGNLECFSLLAGMARITERVTIGSLVACSAFRNPNLVADMARTIDHISGGRFMLGVGAGWIERDFAEYGYEFGTKGSRLRRLEGDLLVIRQRLTALNPPPKGRLPLLVGGMGERVMLRLVATFADVWHGFGTRDLMEHKLDALARWCDDVGRDPSAIELAATVQTADGRFVDPDGLVELGFTRFVVDVRGPDYDFGRLQELIGWRDRMNSEATVQRQ